jgi:hypothetical protein
MSGLTTADACALFYVGTGMTAFHSHSVTIGQLLDSGQNRIVVPEFQRGYSWEKRHVGAFWEDIEAFQTDAPLKGKRSKHFLGPIVIIEENERTLLLDGQQRIATATILLCVIRDCALALGTSDAKVFASSIQTEFIHKEDIGYTLTMSELDNPFFCEHIQTLREIPGGRPKPSVRTNRNILNAHNYLMEQVKALIRNGDPHASLAQLRVLRKTVRDGLVMARILVTSEDDAYHIFETLNDRGLRLSVPDLLLNLLMRSAAKEHRSAIRQLWTDLTQSLKSEDPRDFVRHMWVSEKGDLKRGTLFSALKEHLKSMDALEFTRQCAAECEKYAEILNRDEDVVGKKTAQLLTRLLSDLNVRSSMPLLLSCYGRVTEEQFARIVQLLLVYVTRYSLVMDLDASGMESLLYSLAKDVRAKLKSGVSGSDCVDFIRTTLSGNAPDNDQIKKKMPKLEVNTQTAKYILLRIADWHLSQEKEAATREVNIEHIFPQSPSDEWPNAEEMKPYLWNIGNLTVFGKRKNQSVGNRGFEFKKTKYKDSHVKLTRDVCGYNKWNPEAVKNRATSIGSLIVELWDFTNPTRV